ncbi:hypothetical protein MO867_15260 [Microbulbifer sp. OS29]|uniref:Spore coat protein U domain-containing protein n=1 Tax=Microbulbifer okhotskensis TaxID=2926617 RepID=A0A9X2EQ04_9GAMM|nr:hypothetical protein [Microbulbifer okhotskensis]MCO1335694.1 hypothetical protein [Microbulbifer okhotskensis]
MSSPKQRYHFWHWITLVLSAAVILLFPAIALASCYGDLNLRSCNLQGNHIINYDLRKKNVSFSLRSQRAGHAQPFSVMVTPDAGNNFQLFSDNGESIDISLTISYRNSFYTPLRPGEASNPFPGSLNDTNAMLALEVSSSSIISSNYYQGSFQMQLEQYMDSSPVDSQTVTFTLELEVEPRISIHNLDNIYINGSNFVSGQDITGYEDFCVDGIGFSNYLVSLSSRNGITRTSRGVSMFQLSSPIESLPYAAAFTDDMNLRVGIKTLTAGQVHRGTIRHNQRGLCLTDNARLMVTVPAGSWENSKGSYYTDVLTVTVTSQ